MRMRTALILAMAVLLSAATTGAFPTAAGAAPAATVADFPSWVAVDNFVPPAGAMRPSEGFEGTLSFSTTQMNVTPTPAEMLPVLWGDFSHPWALWNDWGYDFTWLAETDPPGAVPLFDLDATLFPGLQAQFFTTKDGDLVPVQRGVIRRPVVDRTASFWELILSPGRVWKETRGAPPMYKGWNKAAFPFSLVQSQEGEALLGLACFYYRGRDVSPLFVQVSTDSGGGFIFWDVDFDMAGWAEVPMAWAKNTVPPARLRDLRSAYAREVATRWPQRPLSELGGAVAGMGGDVDQANVLTMAMVVDGVIYRTPVHTPFGDYPYPDVMRVGVWSASKSLVPGLAALRIAQKYGPAFLDSKIVDYFSPDEYEFVSTEAAGRWNMVTIRHALQMSTGMGPAGYDENWAWDSTNTYRWSYSYDLADQIWYYFREAPNPHVTGPGQAFYYMDQDMWIAGLCMERYLKQKEGPQATLLGMLSEEVYGAVDAPHFASGTVYTPSGDVGFPYCGWGALPTLDHLAKVGRLLANGGRTEGGTQILDSDLAADLFTNDGYQLSFWKTPYSNASDEHFSVPTMSGAGGNYVFAMPNGLAGIALGCNSYNFSWTTAQRQTVVRAADDIRPF